MFISHIYIYLSLSLSDWADRHLLWIRADFGAGGDGSVIDMSWFSLNFKPSTLAISADLQTVYVANKVRMLASFM